MPIGVAATCATPGCQAVYLGQAPEPGDALDATTVLHIAVIDIHHAGWGITVDRTPGFEYVVTRCPSCTRGGTKVLDRGECTVCLGKTVDRDNAKVCIYCRHSVPYPAEEDWDL